MNDNPIRGRSDDLLNRADKASWFAESLLATDNDRGVVAAIYGDWGSGKTSFLNLVEEHFQKEDSAVILKFNPWLFSSAAQLVPLFFSEVGKQLPRPDYKKLSEQYTRLGAAFSLLVAPGPWELQTIGATLTVIGMLFRRNNVSIEKHRDNIVEQLKRERMPFVVIVDDIDRLDREDAREVFKLVRLIGDFPNMKYILAVDRRRAALQLDEAHFDGEAYLEKIVQLPYELPNIPEPLAVKVFENTVKEAVGKTVGNEVFESQRWTVVYHFVTRTLVATVRDLRRLQMALVHTTPILGERMNAADAVAMEAIRVLRPKLFDTIRSNSELLAPSDIPYLSTLDDESGDEVMRLWNGEDLNFLRHLFPGHKGSRLTNQRSVWLRERRVSHPAILKFYLEQVSNEELRTLQHAEQLFAHLGDPFALNQYLDMIPADRVRKSLQDLSAFEASFTETQATAAIPVLLNYLERMPDVPVAFHDYGNESVVRTLVFLLLKRHDCETTEAITEKLLPKVRRLTFRMYLVDVLRAGEDHTPLVSKAFLELLIESWSRKMALQAPRAIASEPDPYYLLTRYLKETGDRKRIQVWLEDDEIAVRTIETAIVEARTIGPVGETLREHELPWARLGKLFGGSDAMASRLTPLTGRFPENRALSLAYEYITGAKKES